MDDSGLGHQTRDLVRALDPDKVVVIDFHGYNGFKQHPEWYEGRDTRQIKGFINNDDVKTILAETDIVLAAETFYNNRFIDMAHEAGVITICQINYEFFEPLTNRNLRIPERILMPSYWHLEDLAKLANNVTYLPPPTFVQDFDEVRETNYNRTGKRRFLHIAGKVAAQDRAGTLDLIGAVSQCKSDFELVVKVQSGQIPHNVDKRITFDYSSPDDEKELYKDFDAMIHPRRYAGLNLPMNEALSSGLPVIMTDIAPNNRVLPRGWLITSSKVGTFFARTIIDVYSANRLQLADKLDQFATISDDELKAQKTIAHEIAIREYSPVVFKQRWEAMLKLL